MALSRIEIKSMIGKHGHMMLGVGAKPSFTYTIGLYEKYGFELIMVGLRYEFAGQILNDVADYMKAGNSLDLEKEYGDFTNLPVRFRMCDAEKAAEYVVQAENYYGQPVNVVQLVMCDREGRFPEDPNYDFAYMDSRQTLLYPPPKLDLQSIAKSV